MSAEGKLQIRHWTITTLVGIVIFLVSTFVVPGVGKIYETATKVAVLESQYDNINSQLKEIKELLREK